MSPYWATSLSVTFGPEPPMRMGNFPCGGGIELGQPVLDPRQRRLELAQPVGGVAELVAVLVVVALEPAGADAEDRSAAAQVVDRPVGVGEYSGLR